jgi:hypothetical protein
VNPLVFAALFAPAVLAAPSKGTLDLGDRTEVRGGYFGFPTDPSLNVETVPNLGMALVTRRSSLTLSYAPRLGLVDLQQGQLNPTYLHNGFVEAAWHTRSLRLSLSEYASYGSLNYSALRLPGASALLASGTISPLLRQRLLYEASSTTLAAVLTPERRWSMRLALSYSLSGGADDEARAAALRLQHGPRFETAFDYRLTRIDHLITTGSVEQTTSDAPPAINGNTDSTRYDYVFVEAMEGWAHRYTRWTEAEFAAGVTEVAGRSTNYLVSLASTDTSYKTYPTLQATVLHHMPYRDKFDLRFRGQLVPAINRLNGIISEQAQGLANATFRRYPWSFVVDAGFAKSIDDTAGRITTVSSQLALIYRVNKQVDLEAGTSLGWQKVGDADGLFQRLAFVAVTLRSPTLRF